MVGIAGWDYPDWAGVVYPSPRPRGFHPIPYLSQFLDLLEVNSTYYNIPHPRVAESWVRRAEKTPLKFVVKLFQGFTHEPDLLTDESADRFRELLQPLTMSGRYAGLLAQFPQRFHAHRDSLEVIRAVAEIFPDRPLFFEFRHISWEDDRALNTIKEIGAEIVSLDYPFMASPQSPALFCLNGCVYVRFHGRNRENWYRMASETASREEQEAIKIARYDYRYSPDELKVWVAQLRQCAENIQRALLVFNNHARGQEVENAIMTRYLLTGAPVSIPPGPLLDNRTIAPYVTGENKVSPSRRISPSAKMPPDRLFDT